MQEVNWNNFKAKFNGKEQKSFEWLCYLLFCDEFNINTGIFRYKNQAGIETEPIEKDGKFVGFQAKFYETKINDNKADIKDSIAKAKSKNQKLNKLLFYLNQEFSESSKKNKKEPAYKTEIEEYAKSQGVELEWRVRSHFEAQLALDKNKSYAQHFFSLGKSIIDFIDELTQHTESILKPIRSQIQFKQEEIKIDRSQTINSLKTACKESPIVLLSGEAGTGKTALIKDLYNQIKEQSPFFVFKAIEFNIPNVNHLFAGYGQFKLLDFIKEYESIDEKYLIIDSAEKLSDVEYQEVFQEFLSAVLHSNWRIVFTTRYNYLEDLRFQFVNVYDVKFQSFNVSNLTDKELIELSKKYQFNLPDNERLLELLKIPFYLNEYLQNYATLGKGTSFSDFKNILWNKQIAKTAYRKDDSHIRREECFLKIAHKRASEGHFFVNADDCDRNVLHNLETDEIIKHDPASGGYFITQDIYEEWALDKIVERGFQTSADYRSFLQNIGSSLPIRRAFRNWLSEKLLNNAEEVKSLIETIIIDEGIESYWKDEILISVLLSDYSVIFFQLFENKLLEDKQKFLMRIIFLLRIACKGIDEDFLKLLGIQKTEGVLLKTVFTKPKGNGWNCVIDFIYKHKTDFGLQNINIILPLLDDWNKKNQGGDVTKKASLIALFYYDELTKNNSFGYKFGHEKEKQLIRVILQGASEITEELKVIFDEIISKKLTNYRDKYYGIAETILTSMTDGFEVIKSLPNYVIKLADLFWFQQSPKAGRYSVDSIGLEQDFGLSEKHDFKYWPASAFQTPIFQLLRFAPDATVDFILSFTNKAVDCYAKSKRKNEIEEVKVYIDGTKPVKQYINNRLWNMYRGTQVSSDLIESIHMALEKWLLAQAKSASKEILESWCLYLIKNSKSASITAVVTSVVLAQPSKLFNIAKILFKTKEFFLYDTTRFMNDQTAKSLFSLGYGLNFERDLYHKERIETCEDEHRKWTLEHIALQYQVIKFKDESEDEVEERQRTIWEIWDKYYQELPSGSQETESDKTWRLYLARMDRRKMRPEVEEKDGKVLIKFNPEIDPELKKYSEDSINRISTSWKYSALKMWADYRFRMDDKSKQYQQYENNPKLVVTETEEIIAGLTEKRGDDYYLFNHSIPAYTCSVLLRDYFDKLNSEEKKFCKEIIIEYASIPFKAERYIYQISDGTEPSIVMLPDLIKNFPEDKEDVKLLLLLLLLSPERNISTFATSSILFNLWKIDFDAAHALFLGYLLLKPKYDELSEKIRTENFQKNIYEFSRMQIFEDFIKTYENELKKAVSNEITYAEVGEVKNLDLETLTTAFELLPLKTKNEDHRKFVASVFPVFSIKVFENNRSTNSADYELLYRLRDKFANFILTSTKDEIEMYMKPFLDNLNESRETADFLRVFISAEDRLNNYEEFWIVWKALYPKIVTICSRHNHYADEVLYNYLLAWPFWKEDAKEWHTLKEREKSFYGRVVKDIGSNPTTLYSIAKVLNDIGSKFIDDGIIWISTIIQKYNPTDLGELEANTIYYIENFMRRYIFIKRQTIKKTSQIKNQVLVILTFLVEKGSTTGYLLREDVL